MPRTVALRAGAEHYNGEAMFNCRDSIDLLLAYLEGDLPGDVRAELDAHFGECSPCEEFLATYRATPELCRKALAAKMPEEFAERLTEFVRNHLAAKSK